MNISDELFYTEPEDAVLTATDILENFKNTVNDAIILVKKFLAAGSLITILAMPLGESNAHIIMDTPESIEFVIPTINKIKYSIKEASTSVYQNKLSLRLNYLSTLKDGWDNECAKAPSISAIRSASFLISQLDDVILSKCSIFPSNDSGLYIQGKFTKGKVTIFTNNGDMTYVAKGALGKISASVPVNEATVDYLNQGLKQYV